MGIVSCEDIGLMVIDEITDSLPGGYAVLGLRLNVFKMICRQFDNLRDKLEIQTFAVEVNREDFSIVVSIVCPMLTADRPVHPICELIEEASAFKLEPLGDGEYLRAEFVYPGIWAEN